MQVISIIPRLLPVTDGVGDYALNLARQLCRDFGIDTHFIVGDPTWKGTSEIEGFSISQVTRRSASTLRSLLSFHHQTSITVLLHYVGYGYAKRGEPFWLVEGLERWYNGTGNAQLVTMFHELYAFGPPWTSAFWLSPLQKNLATRLAQLSDRCLTSRKPYADTLFTLSQGKQTAIPTLPIFSNLGEPEKVPKLTERQRRLVVFGGQSNRQRVYQKSSAELNRACQLLGIEEVLDVGPSTNLSLSTVNGVSVVEMGKQPAPVISRLLLNSLAGFFDYHTDFLAKSTIFAAYCAHGILPISARCNGGPVDGIAVGKHYWIPDTQAIGLMDLTEGQAIADNAYTWYHTHNLLVAAKTFAPF